MKIIPFDKAKDFIDGGVIIGMAFDEFERQIKSVVTDAIAKSFTSEMENSIGALYRGFK